MDIREFLRSRHVPYGLLLHGPMPTSAQRAHSIRVSGDRVAKAVLIRVETRFILAILPASSRIDLDRLAQIVGESGLRLATEEELETVFTDCERGAIPPFGKLYGLATYVDSRLANGGEIVVEGNTRHEGLQIRFRDYEILESPIRGRFAEPLTPRRRRSAQRRAG